MELKLTWFFLIPSLFSTSSAQDTGNPGWYNNGTAGNGTGGVSQPRGPDKDRLAEQVCENFATLTGRTSGFAPAHTTKNPRYSNELQCKIQPNYPCFPADANDYLRLKRHYKDGYAVPPDNTPGLRETFCLSGVCDPKKKKCTDCMNGTVVINCSIYEPPFKAMGSKFGLAGSRDSLLVLAMILVICYII